MLMGKDFIDELDGEYVSGLMGKSQNVGVHQAFAVGTANSPLHDMSFDSILEFHQTRGVLAKQTGAPIVHAVGVALVGGFLVPRRQTE